MKRCPPQNRSAKSRPSSTTGSSFRKAFWNSGYAMCSAPTSYSAGPIGRRSPRCPSACSSPTSARSAPARRPIRRKTASREAAGFPPRPVKSPFPFREEHRVEKGDEKSIVLYWYQSRDRVIASEYLAKIYLVLDAMRYRRSDTALVRVVVPVIANDTKAATATGVPTTRRRPPPRECGSSAPFTRSSPA